MFSPINNTPYEMKNFKNSNDQVAFDKNSVSWGSRARALQQIEKPFEM